MAQTIGKEYAAAYALFGCVKYRETLAAAGVDTSGTFNLPELEAAKHRAQLRKRLCKQIGGCPPTCPAGILANANIINIGKRLDSET